MIGHVRIKYRAEDVNFIVKILQPVKEGGVFLFHLSDVDGISDVWWQPIILLSLPVSVFRNSTLMVVTMRVATRGRTREAVYISVSDQPILTISGRVYCAVEIREEINGFAWAFGPRLRLRNSLIYQEVHERIILGKR